MSREKIPWPAVKPDQGIRAFRGAARLGGLFLISRKHGPEPYYRAKKRRWYVQLDGKQVNLGPCQQDAWVRYHQIMADRARGVTVHSPISPLTNGPPLVVAVLDAYLDWLHHRVAEGNKAQRTWEWYRDYLQSFANFEAPGFRIASLTVEGIQPFHVYQWADSHPGWKRAKRGAMVAVQRALNWAAKAGLLKAIGGRSPLGSLEKPAQGRREILITTEEFVHLLALVRDQQFADLLTVAWETGARPHELMTVEARHVDLANSRWIFPAQESKGKKQQRVVYLTEKALAITTRLIGEHPTGPLFRNTRGKPWCRFSVNCRLDRLRLAVGRKRLKARGGLLPLIDRLTAEQKKDPLVRAEHRQLLRKRRVEVARLARLLGPRFSLYAIRHAWCTRALESGRVDAVTVSVLMGHRDTQMISRVYSHLTQRPDHLRNAARKVSGA